MNVDIRIAGQDSIDDVMKLIRSEYSGEYASEQYWNWRYFKNPAGQIRLYAAFSENNRIVALQAVASFRSICGTKKTGTLHLLTAALTHTDFRRKGLFRYLVSEICRSLTSHENSLVFTVPNALSEKAFGRFEHWYKNRTLQWWVKPTLLRWRRSSVTRTDPEITEIQPDEWPVSSGMTGNWLPEEWHIERSKDYIMWRYGCQAPFDYRIHTVSIHSQTSGYMITGVKTLLGRNMIVIADLMASSETLKCHLLKTACDIAASHSLTGVAALIPEGYIPLKTLALNGFIPVSPVFLRRKFHVFACEEKTGSMLRHKPLFVMPGDSDLV